ncbi:MAG: DUF5320 domain-containing protein [Bacillota bacterium]|nr:DUF5320 domain-containing protein [Bacillota bacterium]MDD3298537.1 DUF5320 domain-containing protein [Bacillota bacterium]MDD3851488.1 DUF5320 domain-containing protein [Bacillota bacterium]MDD4708110.1 DUF5320 domain-containing protein [Bacillota bacterium]
MPRRDGTGPLGFGPLTGRGLGFCNMANISRLGLGLGFGLGLGLGRGRGFGRRMAYYPAQYPVEYPAGYPVDAKTQKELLEEQKAFFEDRLNMISKQLNGLSDND